MKKLVILSSIVAVAVSIRSAKMYSPQEYAVNTDVQNKLTARKVRCFHAAGKKNHGFNQPKNQRLCNHCIVTRPQFVLKEGLTWSEVLGRRYGIQYTNEKIDLTGDISKTKWARISETQFKFLKRQKYKYKITRPETPERMVILVVESKSTEYRYLKVHEHWVEEVGNENPEDWCYQCLGHCPEEYVKTLEEKEEKVLEEHLEEMDFVDDAGKILHGADKKRVIEQCVSVYIEQHMNTNIAGDNNKVVYNNVQNNYYGGPRQGMNQSSSSSSADVNKQGAKGFTKLTKAVKLKRLKDLNDLLFSDDVNVDMPDGQGRTALTCAVKGGSIEILNVVLDLEPSLEQPNGEGCTAIMLAVIEKNIDIVQKFVQLANENNDIGINTTINENNDMTPLFKAVDENQVDIVKSLVRVQGIDVNQVTKGYTPLMRAAENMNNDIFELLLVSNGMDVNASGEYGYTPLHIAVREGNDGVICPLLENGANPNSFSADKFRSTPLHFAAILGNVSAVELLFTGGKREIQKTKYGESVRSDVVKTDVTALDAFGKTAIQNAVTFGMMKVIKVLLKYGADARVKDVDGRNLLHFAAMSDNDDLVQFLVQKGVKPNDQDKDKLTALHVAAKKGRDSTVKILVENGSFFEGGFQGNGHFNGVMPLVIAHCKKATFEFLMQRASSESFFSGSHIQTGIKGTLLQIAAQHGKDDIVRLIMKNSKNVTDFSKTVALIGAAAHGHNTTIKMLINEFGTKPEVPEGGTPCAYTSFQPALHCAAERGYDSTVKFLLSKGVKVNSQDTKGRTSLHIAAARGHDTIIKIIVKNYGLSSLDVKDKRGLKSLYYAAMNLNESTVKLLLELGSQADTKALLWTIIAAGDDIVEYRQDNLKVVSRAEDDTVHLKFQDAATKCSIIECLIKHGADPDCLTTFFENNGSKNKTCKMRKIYQFFKSRQEWFPVLAASSLNSDHGLQIVKCLLENNADISCQASDGATALQQAAALGHENTVIFFLENNAKFEDVKQAFLCSAENGHLSIVNMLQPGVKQRSSPDQYWQNIGGALIRATAKGHKEVVNTLFMQLTGAHSDGLELNMVNGTRPTGEVAIVFEAVLNALFQAVLNGQASMVAKFNEYNVKADMIMLEYAVASGFDTTVEILITPRTGGYGIKPHEYRKPEHNSRKPDSSEPYETILHHMAKSYARTSNKIPHDRRLAIHNACYKGATYCPFKCVAEVDKNRSGLGIPYDGDVTLKRCFNIVKMLVGKGVEVNRKADHGRTALHFAVVNGHRNIIKALIDNGADTHAKDDENQNPLHIAAKVGNLEAVKIFVHAGTGRERIFLQEKNNDGQTALMIAEQEKQKLLNNFTQASQAGIFACQEALSQTTTWNYNTMNFDTTYQIEFSGEVNPTGCLRWKYEQIVQFLQTGSIAFSSLVIDTGDSF
eukprot:gene152-967_t